MGTQFTLDLPAPASSESIGPGASILRGFARPHEGELLAALEAIIAAAPLRQMTTPGGRTMAVAMTNCGPLGWVSDERGYRYEARDPRSGRAWPTMPGVFLDLSRSAAARAGWTTFSPNACLVNRYQPGTRLTLHQDKDELDLSAPIVSVSLGVSATFLFGGVTREAPTRRVRLDHGDVVIWGGASRLAFHGVLPLEASTHRLTAEQRFNLTFRCVG